MAQSPRPIPFKRTGAADWTAERIAQLGKQDIEQLRENALRLGEEDLATLCAQMLSSKPKASAKGDGPPAKTKKNLKLVARTKAFEMHGVHLLDPRTSWSGVRKHDGAVVIALWAAAIEARDGTCSCLLWAPSENGDRAWSDSGAGKERLEHCKMAVQKGGATGLMVHGERLADRLPEDKARSVHGVDSTATLAFTVEKRGDQYWAVWGKKAA
jgi:hypothetical protein